MKTKIIYYVSILLIAGMFSPTLLKADNYVEEEVNALVTFLEQLSGDEINQNWEIAEFEKKPSEEDPEEVIRHLVEKRLITINLNYSVKDIALTGDYGGNLILENFSNLGAMTIKDCAVENIQSVSNNTLTKVTISNCSNLEKTAFLSGHLLLKDISISGCPELQEIDLYGSDSFDPLDTNKLNPALSSMVITTCPSLKTLNFMGCTRFSDYYFNIDNTTTVTTLYTAGSKNLSMSSRFDNLEILDCSYSQLTYLYISNPHKLHTLRCDHNNIDEIHLPEGKYFNYKTDDIRISFNALNHNDIKNIFGSLQPEMLTDNNIYPQKIKKASYWGGYEFVAVGNEVDVSKEKFDAAGTLANYTWYSLTDDQADIILRAQLEDKSLTQIINEGLSSGEIEKLNESSHVYTPEKELKGVFLLCAIETVVSGIRALRDIDPEANIYRLFQVIIAPKVELEIKIDDGEWKPVLSGDNTIVDEGTSVSIRAKLNRDGEGGTDRFHYSLWTLYFMEGEKEVWSYSMTLPREVIYYFNYYEPYTEKGTYEIETTRIMLQTGDFDVGVFPAPAIHTIIIKGEEDPGPEPEDGTPPDLQYKVKVNKGAYYDVPTGGTTEEQEGNNVYLAIVPDDKTGDIDYDRWKISYYDPDDNYVVSPQMEKGALYEFNPASPHHTVGTYPYEVKSLYLYKNGFMINGEPYPKDDKYTIRITKKDDPGPSDPFPGIDLQEQVTLCTSNEEILIPFDLLHTEDPVYYRMHFSEEALRAGFKDMEAPLLLPTDGFIRIPLPYDIKKGVYRGIVHLSCENHPRMIEKYNFEIHTLQATVIIRQPLPADNLCIGDPVALEVEAEGESLTYQWYYEDEAIAGATLPQHQISYCKETSGSYYVIISGLCGVLKSDVVTITGNRLYIEMKWDDVLYIRNPENKYATFQWYKNGEKIIPYGNSTYYTDAEGLSGSYMVRAFYSDGNYIESCSYPIEIETKEYGINVFPTSVARYGNFTVEITGYRDITNETRIEIIDMYGKIVHSIQATGSRIDIPVTCPAGIYIIKVTSPMMRSELKKILVKE